jgi:large subunit ribosomal protein L27
MGLKLQHNAKAKKGSILVRQRGTKYHPGENVGIGRDFTLYAQKEGVVSIHYDVTRQRNYISVDAQNVMPKSRVKEQLRSMVDVEKYLSLSSKERYDYVMELVKQMNTEKPQTPFPPPPRVLDLKDLTLSQ